jgi:hypothetical protein
MDNFRNNEKSLAYYSLFNNYIRSYIISDNVRGNPKGEYILMSRIPIEQFYNDTDFFIEDIDLELVDLEFGPVEIQLKDDYAICFPKIFWIRLFQRKWRKNRYYKSNKYLLNRQFYGNINRNKYYNGGFRK